MGNGAGGGSSGRAENFRPVRLVYDPAGDKDSYQASLQLASEDQWSAGGGNNHDLRDYYPTSSSSKSPAMTAVEYMKRKRLDKVQKMAFMWMGDEEKIGVEVGNEKGEKGWKGSSGREFHRNGTEEEEELYGDGNYFKSGCDSFFPFGEEEDRKSGRGRVRERNQSRMKGRKVLLAEEEEQEKKEGSSIFSSPIPTTTKNTVSSSPLSFATDEAAEAFLEEENALDREEQRIPTLQLAAEYHEELASYANEELDIASSALVKQKTTEEREEERITPHASFFTAYYQQQGLLPVSHSTSSRGIKGEEEVEEEPLLPVAIQFQRHIMQTYLGVIRFRVEAAYPLTRIVVRHQLETHMERSKKRLNREEEDTYIGDSPPSPLSVAGDGDGVFQCTPDDPLVYTMRLLPEASEEKKEMRRAARIKGEEVREIMKEVEEGTNEDGGNEADSSSFTALPYLPLLGAPRGVLEEDKQLSSPPSPSPLPSSSSSSSSLLPLSTIEEMKREYAQVQEMNSTFPTTMTPRPPPSPLVASLDQYIWLQRQVACGSVVLTDTFSQWVASITAHLCILQAFSSCWLSSSCSSSLRFPVIVDLFGGPRRRMGTHKEQEEREGGNRNRRIDNLSYHGQGSQHDYGNVTANDSHSCRGGTDIILDAVQYLSEEVQLLRSLHSASSLTTTSDGSATEEKNPPQSAAAVPPSPLPNRRHAEQETRRNDTKEDASAVLDRLDKTLFLSLLSSCGGASTPSLSQRHPNVVYLAPNINHPYDDPRANGVARSHFSKGRQHRHLIGKSASSSTTGTPCSSSRATRSNNNSSTSSTAMHRPATTEKGKTSMQENGITDLFSPVPFSTLHGVANIVWCFPPTSEDGRRVRCTDEEEDGGGGSFLENRDRKGWEGRKQSRTPFSPDDSSGASFSPNNFIFRCQEAASVYFPRLKKALQCALECAQDGGLVMYGTHSLNPLENEAVVAAVLSAHQRAKEGRRKTAVTSTAPLPPSSTPVQGKHLTTATTMMKEGGEGRENKSEEHNLRDNESEACEGLLRGVDWVECVPMFSSSSSPSSSSLSYLPKDWQPSPSSSSLSSCCYSLWKEWYSSSFIQRTHTTNHTTMTMDDVRTAYENGPSASSLPLPPLRPPYRAGLLTWYGAEGGAEDQEPSGCVPEVVEAVGKASIRVNPLTFVNSSSSSSSYSSSAVDDFWFFIVLRVHRSPRKEGAARETIPPPPPSVFGSHPRPGEVNPSPDMVSPSPSGAQREEEKKRQAESRISNKDEAWTPASAWCSTPFSSSWSSCSTEASPSLCATGNPFLCSENKGKQRGAKGSLNSSSLLRETSSLVYLCSPSVLPWWMLSPTLDNNNAREESGKAKAKKKEEDVGVEERIRQCLQQDRWRVAAAGLPVGMSIWKRHILPMENSNHHSNEEERGKVVMLPPFVFLFSSVLSGTSFPTHMASPPPSVSSSCSSICPLLVHPPLQLPSPSFPDSLLDVSPRCSSVYDNNNAHNNALRAPCASLPLWCLLYLLREGELTSHTLRSCLSLFHSPPASLSSCPSSTPPPTSRPSSSFLPTLPSLQALLLPLQAIQEVVIQSTIYVGEHILQAIDASKRTDDKLEKDSPQRWGIEDSSSKRSPTSSTLSHPSSCSWFQGMLWLQPVHMGSLHRHRQEQREREKEETSRGDEQDEKEEDLHRFHLLPEIQNEFSQMRILTYVSYKVKNFPLHPPRRTPSLSEVAQVEEGHEEKTGVGDEWSIKLISTVEEKSSAAVHDPFRKTRAGPPTRRRSPLSSSSSAQKEEFALMLQQQERRRNEMRIRLRDTLWYTAQHMGGAEAIMSQHVPPLLTAVRGSGRASSFSPSP